MITAVRKVLINLSTRWRLSKEIDGLDPITDREHQHELSEDERRMSYAYSVLCNSPLGQSFHLYLERSEASSTSFILGKYIGYEGQISIPEISVTVYASPGGYTGMLVKTLPSGKLDFIQYQAKTALEISDKIMDYLKLL